MLVLTRHIDEKVILELEDGRVIEVMPVDLRGDKARLGITAPRTIGIHREEVYRAIVQHRADSSHDSPPPAA